MKVKIKNIKKIRSNSKRYDIQTKTSNFFANNILVHNSLIHVYWDWVREEWCAGTTGTAEGEGEVNNKFGTTFADLFWNTAPDNIKDSLIKGYTYVFELCTPYNIVVKPHATSSVTLLAIRDLSTLRELKYETVRADAVTLGVPAVKAFDMNAANAGHVIKTLEGMPYTEEGYVVVDDKHNRIKIKNPAYVAVHGLKNKTAEYRIVEIIRSNEVEEFGAVFPGRKKEVFKLRESYENIEHKLNKTWEELKNHLPENITKKEQKKYAMKVFEISKKFDTDKHTGLFFGLKDGKVKSIKDYLLNMDDKKLYNIL